MSWSVNLFGSPEKVAEALETVNSGYSGPSKDEWESAKPHLIAMVNANFVSDEAKKLYPGGYTGIVVNLAASGSGTWVEGRPVSGSCSVKLESIYTNLV